MAAHDGQQPQPEQVEQENTQEEKQPEFYDDKLARDLYKDYSSQNAFAIQLMLAGAAGGVLYCREVVDAYNLLKKPLDPEKLLTDPVYKARVERATQLVKRHEGKRRLESGKSKYSETIRQTNLALSEVKTTHNQTVKIKEGMGKQYSIDMRRLYGLGDEEIKKIQQAALDLIKENPGLSMQEAMRREARRLYLPKQVEKEVKGDKTIKLGQEKDEIARRIKEKEEKFLQQTETLHQTEKLYCGKQLDIGRSKVADALGIELKPAATPSVTTTTPAATTPLPSITTISPTIPTPTVPFPSHPSIPLPTRLKTGFSTYFPKLGGLSGKLGGFSFGNLLKRGITKLGSSLALKLGLNAIPGIGTAASIALTIAEQIPGVNFAIDFTKKIVIITIAILVIAPILFTVGFVIYIAQSGNNIPAFSQTEAVKVSLSKDKNLSWQEFEKKYLTIPALSRALSDEDMKY